MKRKENRKLQDSGSKLNENDSKRFDFIVLFFICCYLFIDFMPYAQRMEIIKPQFLYLTILNAVVATYVYFNPTLYLGALTSIFKRSYIFKAYLLFILLAGVSIFSAKNTSLSINAISEIVVVFGMVLNFAILLCNRTHLMYRLIFIVGLCALLQAFNALLNLKQFFLHGEKLFDVLNATKGNTGNKNILSASIMAKIPFILIGIVHFVNWKRWILVLSLLSSTSLIFLLGARSSLLSLTVILIIYFVYFFKNTSFNRNSLGKASYIISPIVIALVAVNLLFFSVEGSSSTVSRLQQINTSDASANNRLNFWKVALDFSKHNPVSGIGLGNWRIESIPHEVVKNKVVGLSVHNDFLEIFAEMGVLNGIVYLSIFIALLAINLKVVFRSRFQDAGLKVLLPLLLLIVYGIDALFNFPLYRPTMQLCFCFIMAFTFIGEVKADTKVVALKKPKSLATLILIAVIPLYVTYHADLTSQLEYRIKSDDIDFNAVGKLTGDEVMAQKPLFPNVFNTSESFAEYAGIYYFREKKYDKAIRCLDKANTINPYLGRPDFYKYLVATEKAMPDSAYHYLKSSFYTYPTNSTLAHALVIAEKYRDTTEILKLYKLSSKYQKDAMAWGKTVRALQGSGYSDGGLSRFLREGMLDFQNDSLATSAYKSALITQHIIKGQRLFANGRHQEALATYQRALQIDPADIYLQQNLGFYFYNLRKAKEAIPHFLNALSRPGLVDGKTEYYLGLCFINVGQKTEACRYLNIASGKNFPGANIALQQFCGN